MAIDVVPVIDLAGVRLSGTPQDWRTTARQIDDACYNSCVFAIAGHGISDDLLKASRELSLTFFHQPNSAKMQVHLPGHGRGYIPFESERLGATRGDRGPGDLRESFNICADFADNVWPVKPPTFRTTLEQLFREMHNLTNFLMRLCAVGLKLPSEYFDEYIRDPKATLRLSYYPAVAQAVGSQIRGSSHTDYGTLTVLYPDPGVGGLQVLLRDKEWVNVINPPGTLVINIGDMMDMWTNGKWRATVHRVTADEKTRRQERLSLVFLHNPNPTAVIAPVSTCVSEKFPQRYNPIVAGEHLRSKSRQSRGEHGPPT
ncbi:MAG: hypothetical protein QOI07_3236 [Verrucomicrobiota bacterium]